MSNGRDCRNDAGGTLCAGCNAHDDLVESLQKMIDWTANREPINDEIMHIACQPEEVQKAMQAIEKASAK